jgi:N-acyl-D-aspartate/D-glutamate deacylase
MRRAAQARLFLLACAVAAGAPSPQSAPRYDLAILGGQVVDGTGAPRRRADVAIAGGRIAAIGRVSKADARDVIDATGMIVAPGFIDVHTHADDIAENPRAENFVRMGVTTIVAGNCGSSALDIGESLSQIRQIGPSVNYATLIGHNTVRRAVMGTDDRIPRVPELNRMKSLVWRGMTDGAVGFSTGLQYVPGTYARLPEIIELARIAGNAGGVYASHMRNEGTELEASVRDTITVGATTGCRVQISHLKVDSPNHWGESTTALALIDAARAKGVVVEADQYAYTAASSSLSIRFPSWALEGGPEQTAARLEDPETWRRIKADMQKLLADRGLQDLSFAVVASYRADPSLNGLSLKQVAARFSGSDRADAQFEAARTMMLAGGAAMVYHLMSENDIERIMKHPQVGVASDSSVLKEGDGVPHPRGYGNNARVLAEYVRHRGVITMEEAIRKMTSLPAEQFRFERRGRVKEGFAADLVVFDPGTVGDTATYQQPHAYPTGIPHVIVNGVPVVRDGQHTGARSGMVLDGQSRSTVK